MPYFVSIKGQSFGPAEIDDLRLWHRAGSFSPSDFVWDDATQTWIEAIQVPALSTVFLLPPTPTAGVEDVEELPRSESIAVAAEAIDREPHCDNHEMEASTGVCPRCRRSLCDRCLVSVDGLRVCVDCIGEQKGAATSGWKRTAVLAGGLLSIPACLLAVYLFASSTAAPQSETPERVTIKLGEPPPPIATEFLVPAEREKAEAAMKLIFEAIAAAPAAVISSNVDYSRITIVDSPTLLADPLTALVAAGRLATRPEPPRPGLEFRIALNGKDVELWTTGSTPRGFLVYDQDGLKDVPKE